MIEWSMMRRYAETRKSAYSRRNASRPARPVVARPARPVVARPARPVVARPARLVVARPFRAAAVMAWTRFFRRNHWDDERARELEAHLAIETDENIARGMTPREAREA